MVADSFWGSTPMNTLAMTSRAFAVIGCDRRVGIATGSGAGPLEPHAGTVIVGNAARNEPHPNRVGGRKEGFAPITWTESGRTPVVRGSSTSRLTDLPIRGSY